jgi:hypothetical protein
MEMGLKMYREETYGVSWDKRIKIRGEKTEIEDEKNKVKNLCRRVRKRLAAV